MRYVYPALIFKDGEYTGITVPDLPGCHTFGENLADALLMGKDAIETWLWDAENKKEPIPTASKTLEPGSGETLTFIAADTDEYRQANDTRAIKKTLTIPSWLNYQAEKANAPFSQILQQGLKEYLNNAEG